MVSDSDIGLGIEDELLRQSVTDTGSGSDSARILIRVTDGAEEVEVSDTVLVSDNVGRYSLDATDPWNSHKIAVGPDGRLWATYGKVVSTRRQIIVAYSDDGETWTEEQITTASAHHYMPCIAVDPAGVVHLAYTVGSRAYYRTRTADVWSAATHLSKNTTRDQTSFGMAIGPDGVVHVAMVEYYYVGPPNYYDYEVHYRKKTTEGWQDNEILATDPSMYYVSLAVDSSSRPHVVWEQLDGEGYGTIYYITYSGAWGSIERVSPAATICYYPDIAVGSDVHVAYRQGTSILCSTKSGTWTTATLGTGETPSVGVSGSTVCVIWRNGDLYFSYYDEGWITPGALTSGGDARHPSFANGSLSFVFTVLTGSTYSVRYGGPGVLGLGATEMGIDSLVSLTGTLELSDQARAIDTAPPRYQEVLQHPHLTKMFLAVKRPKVIWRGRVANNRGYEDGDVLNDQTITLSEGANVIGFDVDDFLPDLTLWVGTTLDGKQHGVCRLKDVGASLSVAADTTCVWKAGDYITVTDLHELWPRAHRVEEEDGNITVWKDWDLDATYRVQKPVPVFGPPACVFLSGGSVTVTFNAGDSYLVQHNSDEYDDLGWADRGITAYAWWFEGVGADSGQVVQATFTTAGQYTARLTVTGINGETERGFRNVFVFDDNNPPVTAFALQRLEGNLDNRGWEAEVEVLDTNFDPDTLPNNAQVVLSAEESFGGQPKLGMDKYGRSYVKMLGWARDARVRYVDGVRTARMTIKGLQEYLQTVENFPAYWTQIDANAPDWSYFEANAPTVDDGLTVRKALYHLIRWHWTLFTFTDVLLPEDHNNFFPGQNFPEGSLGKQLDDFVKDVQCRWAVSKGGALHIFSWMNWLPVTGDGAWWRFRLTPLLDITDADFESLEVEPRASHRVARVRVEGVMSSDSGWYATSIDTVPGDIRGFAGETITVANQVLGTSGFEGSQGWELARMVYAEASRRVETLRLQMCGNYSAFDIVPEMNKITLTHDPNARGFRWTESPFWVTGMSLRYDNEKGDLDVSLTCTPETWFDADLDVYSQVDEVPTDVTDIPAGGNSLLPAMLADIDAPDASYIPALMGWGSLCAGPEAGTTYVRLYGDNKAVVLAENRTYKSEIDRPCFVVQKAKGRPGNAPYEIVAVRRMIGAEGDTDLARAYQIHRGVLCYSGELETGESADMHLPVDGEEVYAIEIDATLRVAGGDVSVTVTRNGSTLGSVSIGSGSTRGTALLDPMVQLSVGDVLDFTITAANPANPGEDLAVTVVTREYGV